MTGFEFFGSMFLIFCLGLFSEKENLKYDASITFLVIWVIIISSFTILIYSHCEAESACEELIISEFVIIDSERFAKTNKGLYILPEHVDKYNFIGKKVLFDVDDRKIWGVVSARGLEPKND